MGRKTLSIKLEYFLLRWRDYAEHEVSFFFDQVGSTLDWLDDMSAVIVHERLKNIKWI